MTSRLRILSTINHNEPDKVPIDLGGTACSTLTRVANEKLKKYLNITKGGELITDPIEDSVLPLEEIRDLFGVDVRTVRMKDPTSEIDEEEEERKGFIDTGFTDNPVEDSFLDEFGTRWRKAVYDYVPVENPLANASISDLRTYSWPDPYNPGRVKGLRQEAKRLHENADYAILSELMCGGPFEQASWLRGYEQFLVDLVTNSNFVWALLGKITDIDIGFWDAQLSQIGDYVDVVCQGDDLGMQTSLQISPEMYRKFIKPYHKKLFSFIHSKTKAKLWLHACGSVYSIIPDLIDVGVDILAPVQCGAKNMELKKLKREFGKDITFWGGGIDIQRLPFLSLSEIREHVKKAIYTMAPGGGFVFAASHNILPETEGESTYTAYMAAKEYRDYSTIRQVS